MEKVLGRLFEPILPPRGREKKKAQIMYGAMLKHSEQILHKVFHVSANVQRKKYIAGVDLSFFVLRP